MRRHLSIAFFLVLACRFFAQGEEARVLHMDPPKGMDRADIAYLKCSFKPVAVLVLCPGYNGNAKAMIEQETWQEYAKKNRLGLVGLSFSSPENLLADKGGYYLADQGSGECLVKAVDQAFEEKDLPIFLYGFSGGAHFAGNFAEWNPNRVKGWCSYSAAWWDKPSVKNEKSLPPGIIGCGQLDRYRLGASLLFFKQGRALGRPWLWVELKGKDHAWPRELDFFVRDYFSAILRAGGKEGTYVDLDTKEAASEPLASGQETLFGWLPDLRLAESWQKIHQPQ